MNTTTTAIYTMESFARNSSYVIPNVYDIEIQDASWIMVASIMIFSMQTGFGLLESGIVSRKNEVNIMMKNIVDILLGGITYYIFGYALSYGRSSYTNPFISFGDFMIDPSVDDKLMGQILTAFFFQLSFATTATTILSGTVAERINFHAYCLFSLINTVVYCIPAGWIWSENGFLRNLGVVDIAGSGPVHLLGGASAFAGAVMLGPRLNRYDKTSDKPTSSLPMGNPINACVGLFFLYWGWLAFNAGSTYGLSGQKWEYAARAAFMTMLASFGGGCYSLVYSMIKHKGKLDPSDIINGILASLVAITAGCFLFRAWESIVVGVIGSIFTLVSVPFFDRMEIDDPVGAISVHGIAGIWGVLAVGLFAEETAIQTTGDRFGLFKGGGFYLLSVQALAVICITLWAIFSTFLLLWFVNKITPLRMKVEDEIMGADYAEHNIMPLAIENNTTKTSTALSKVRDESGMPRGFRLHDNNNIKMADAYKTHFTDELMVDRLKVAARENPAFRHDNA